MNESNDLTIPEMVEKALATYSPSEAAIAEMRASFLPLVVKGEDDKAGCAVVRSARLEVKAKRVAVEKCRVGLKEGALRYGQAVDAEARRLTRLLEPIEAHLQAQEDIVAQAAERRKAAEEVARLERLRQRMAALREAESPLLEVDVAGMTEAQFGAALEGATDARTARLEAEMAEAAARRQDSDRLAAERAEQEAVRQQQAAEAKRLAEERAAIEADRAAQQRAADIKAAEERAAVKALEDAKRDAERKAADAAEREAMRPVREKVLSIAAAVEALHSAVPDFKHTDLLRSLLLNTAEEIRDLAPKGGAA